MDFSYSPRLAQLRETAVELARKIAVYEDECEADNGLSPESRAALRRTVLASGLQAMNAPVEWGGAGLSWIEQVTVEEQLGTLTNGLWAAVWRPTAAALIASTPEQRERHLIPENRGERFGARAVTEPEAGSDPRRIATVAERLPRRHSPFYRDLYAALPPGPVHIEDLPVLDHSDFWAANTAHDSRVLTGPLTDGIVFKSGGTTTEPKLSVYTRRELLAMSRLHGNGFAQAGLRPGDRVANLFYAGELYASFLFNVLCLQVSSVPNVHLPLASAPLDYTARVIHEFSATALMGPPTTICQLAARLTDSNCSEVASAGGKRSTRMWCQPSSVSRVKCSMSSRPRPRAVSRSRRWPMPPTAPM
ncbi:acyl-CoA dehydrogenase family protein [Streptomyces tailanensis]|uniref:acyl-CoA dehydrogenase family protein n=1 Tax=Streptomyces tailanensis TaxID=2569858 RepID=UPI001FE669BE|nr:acyl-CoA dehydrogenase family protein [Streptomyces tailanensis]